MFRMTANKIECLVVMQNDELQMSGRVATHRIICSSQFLFTAWDRWDNQYHVTYNPLRYVSDWTGPSSSGSQCPLVWFSNWTWPANLCPPQFQFYFPLAPDWHKPSIYARIRQSLSMAWPVQMNHITISSSSACGLSEWANPDPTNVMAMRA